MWLAVACGVSVRACEGELTVQDGSVEVVAVSLTLFAVSSVGCGKCSLNEMTDTSRIECAGASATIVVRGSVECCIV